MVDERSEDSIMAAHAPAANGSMTERVRGTYGGRQRWLTNGVSDPHSTLAVRHGKMARVTTPSVNSYLGSLGVGTHDETKMLNKEADEVSQLRKEFDTMKMMRSQKEKELRVLEEKLSDLRATTKGRKHESSSATGAVQQLENRTKRVEEKLEEELNDNKVYKHMVERLLGEVQAAKKTTSQKEQEFENLTAETDTNAATLLAARQEKAGAEYMQKELVREMELKTEDQKRALHDLETALQQTKKKQLILGRREESRQQVMAQAVGELSIKESKKLKQAQFLQRAQFQEIQKGLAETDEKLHRYEAEFHKVAEAAGTTEVDHIISKFNSRGETFTALQNEFMDSEARMKSLREKHKLLTENLNNIQGLGTNSRGMYLEMDETADKLKDIEREALVMSEKCNRVNVILDSFRACMVKSLAKMDSIGVSDLSGGSEKVGNDSATTELVHLVEQRLNRVVDTINREKAELELHRAEASQGLRRQDSTDRLLSIRQPAPAESEGHFILRMSNADTSTGNVRVEPAKLRGPVDEDHSQSHPAGDMNHNDHGGDDELVIDRETRKKLANMVVSRGKRGRKSS